MKPTVLGQSERRKLYPWGHRLAQLNGPKIATLVTFIFFLITEAQTTAEALCF